MTVTYRLRWEGEEALVARWAVQWNLTLSAGDAPGRYYRVAGRPSLGSRGRVPAVHGLAMVDEWLGCELALRWANPADIAWAPVETVSLSETGFERIYQGSALLFAWPLRLLPGQTWETSLRVGDRRNRLPLESSTAGRDSVTYPRSIESRAPGGRADGA